MKDLCFNEASLFPIIDVEDRDREYKQLRSYFLTFKEAKKEKFNRIRYEKSFDEIFLSRSRSLTDCCNDLKYKTFSALLLGTARVSFSR